MTRSAGDPGHHRPAALVTDEPPPLAGEGHATLSPGRDRHVKRQPAPPPPLPAVNATLARGDESRTHFSPGGANLAKSFEAAALNGQVATTISLCELDLTPAHFKGLSLHVVFMLIPMLHNFRREAHADVLRELATIVEAGGLSPVLDEPRYTLEDAGKAHARLESGQGMGKVVIEN